MVLFYQKFVFIKIVTLFKMASQRVNVHRLTLYKNTIVCMTLFSPKLAIEHPYCSTKAHYTT